MNWLKSLMKGSRYAMNRKQAEWLASEIEPPGIARAVVAASAFVETLNASGKEHEQLIGRMLSRAMRDSAPGAPADAMHLYNLIEDQLAKTKRLFESLRAKGVEISEPDSQEGELGFRLILVSLARIAEPSFRTTTGAIRPAISEATAHIGEAVLRHQKKQALSRDLVGGGDELDYGRISETAVGFVTTASLSW